MADYTQNIKLSDHKRGDKWVGIPSIGPVTINGSQPSLELVRVRMQFRKGNTVYKLDTDPLDRNAPIVILDPVTWEVTIPEVDDGFLQVKGCWDWDIEFWEDGKNAPLTLFKGEIEIHQDVTV